MDLLIDVLLLSFASIGGFVAIAGKTWDGDNAKGLARLTVLGWIATGCLLLSFGIGVVKELRTSEAEAVLTAENSALKSTVDNVRQSITGQDEIRFIQIQIDAFLPGNGAGGQGFNDLRKLAEFSTGEPWLGYGLGIAFVADYGPLTIYLYGVNTRREEKERWFLKLAFDGKDRSSFYQTEPLEINMYNTVGNSRTPYLVDARLGANEIGGFLVESGLLSELLLRPEYEKAFFDPSFELGSFLIKDFVRLRNDVSPDGFARELAVDWPTAKDENARLSIPDDFLKNWIVRIVINKREIYNLSSMNFVDREASDRLANWPIIEKYKIGHNKILLAPKAEDWADYRTVLNANTRELIYGERGQEREQALEDILPPNLLGRMELLKPMRPAQ
jgi:hypothetical protein